MRAVIAVALHKPAPLPEDPLYLPVQAGAALGSELGVARDDTGVHISPRNPLYCELTVHYWLWQNVKAEVYGLCHYRRYFAGRGRPRGLADILNADDMAALLQEAEVLVPRPRLYLIETNASHYAHAHRPGDLAHLRSILCDLHPDFLPAYDAVMKRRWGRRFNMFVMKREAFQAYSAWLFSVLFALEDRLEQPIPPRTMGFIGERLMDVWLEKTRPRLKELPVLHTEGQDWPRRILRFLGRKIRGNRRISR